MAANHGKVEEYAHFGVVLVVVIMFREWGNRRAEEGWWINTGMSGKSSCNGAGIITLYMQTLSL